MPRPNNQRTETAPVLVRFSPAERANLDAKAARAGETRSGLIRAAVAAFEPGRSTGNDIRTADSDIRVEYDE